LILRTWGAAVLRPYIFLGRWRVADAIVVGLTSEVLRVAQDDRLLVKGRVVGWVAEKRRQDAGVTLADRWGMDPGEWEISEATGGGDRGRSKPRPYKCSERNISAA
jgi:hypothetical protein